MVASKSQACNLIDLNQYILNSELRVSAKPGAKRTEILGFDDSKTKTSVIISIAAPPEDNKANKELIKFVSKLLKKRVLIKSGANSKQKVLKIFD